MLKINLSTLRKKIEKYVGDYYKLKTKPVVTEIEKEKQWVSNMIMPYVEYSIMNLELSKMKRINVSERVTNYNYEGTHKSCITKKGYEIERRLSEYSNKYLLKANKAAKINYISLWQYKQKDEMKSMIANEFAICKKAESLGIGPKTYDAFICYNEAEFRAFKVVITEYISGQPLDKWLQDDKNITQPQRDHVYNLVKAKVEKMHEHGIIHNSLHTGNIILKMKKDTVEDVFITDFVNAYDVQDKSMWDYNKWIRDDRSVLDNIRNLSYSYNNADDVVNYVTQKLLANKEIVIS